MLVCEAGETLRPGAPWAAWRAGGEQVSVT